MAETLARGGDFLFNGALGKRIFSPEDFSDEQRQFADTTEEFVKKEVLPDLDRIEAEVEMISNSKPALRSVIGS